MKSRFWPFFEDFVVEPKLLAIFKDDFHCLMTKMMISYFYLIL